jgi:hypothetical protein
MNKQTIFTMTTAALAMLALSACETTAGGTGSGNVRGSQRPVAFTWQSESDHAGDITATFNSGRVFKGEYFQITGDTHVDRLDPLWDGWETADHHGDWRYWDADSRSDFIRAYRGRVLANLKAENGEYMRCRFTLRDPGRGMSGGGSGRCQLSDTPREINAEFPRQS